MNGHGSFVVTSLFFAMFSTLVGFGVQKTAESEARQQYLPRIQALDEERQELARQVAEVLEAVADGDVLEFGAGSGALAIELLLELERLGRLPARYLILDLSASLRAV